MTRSHSHLTRRRRAGFRPRLETLEDRTAPAVFTVLNTLDNGSVGSLRWAVGQANSHPGPDSIDFDSGVFGTPRTITLSGGQLEMSDTTGATSIGGPAAGVTVSAGGRSLVFQVDALVTASIAGMTITGGKAFYVGGGLFNAGMITLTDCTVTGNSSAYGGGLNNQGTATLVDCTISDNSASALGGGVLNSGTAALVNCTISGNSNSGLFNFYSGTVTLTNCTVSGNSVGGLFFQGFTATMSNTIVAGNSGGDLSGSLAAGSSNNLIGGDPLLAPLGHYGGAVQTMPLLPGSPAIDAGTSRPGIAAADQRGLSRVGAVDIGAFESQGFSFAAAAGSTPQTSDIGTAFARPLAVIVTAFNPIEPVDGGRVSFVANPAANGATAIFVEPSAVITKGQAALTAAPNNILGSYTVVTRAAHGSSATFALSNAGTPFAALVVNTTSDALAPGAGLLSLREAIAFNNASPSGNSPITFDSGNGRLFSTPQKITLTGTQLELSNALGTASITGPAAGVTVDGDSRSRVLQVDAAATASISGITFIGGNSGSFGGGGLNNLGTATFINCTFSGNFAYDRGGGMANDGTATLVSCTFSGNSAPYSYSYGHGGGGVANGGTATLIGCIFSGNSAGYGGGVASDGTVTLVNCTFSGNSARYHSSFGAGGGVANDGTATLVNCTFSGNSAYHYGGCVANRGTAMLINCTVGINSALFGGGLTNQGTATLTNCTVSGNSAYSGGGLTGGGRTTLTNTIVAGNGGGDLDGSIEAASSHNLIGGDLLLAPLGHYGGAVQTMPLLPGSPAIDAGASALVIPTTDQRGLSRVGAVDIGACESQGFNFTIVPGSTPQASNIGTAFAHPLAVSVTANNAAEPVDGGRVRFVAKPAANGASAIFFELSAVITNGHAALNTAPNNVLGSYTVVAGAGSNASATFALTNTGSPIATLVVNTTSDALFPGAGLLSLRQAIAFNNASPSGNSPIIFDSGPGHLFSTPQTIALTGTQLELSNTTGTASITGPAAGLTIDGGGRSRVLQVDELVTASISGMTITRGYGDYGGGVLNSGTVTLNNCTISGNSAHSGGGVANDGTATLNNCTVSGNKAYSGGGVANDGTASLTNCTISGNNAHSGGGVANDGTATLNNCTVSRNSASASGGGLFNSGSLTMSNSTVSGNVAGNDYAGSGIGGGLFNSGSLTMINSTISGNSAYGKYLPLINYGYGSHGGVANDGTATLTNCTISGNSADFGGGLGGGGRTTLTNTIVAGNFGGDLNGAIEAASTNNLIGGDPLLAPLGNYGGAGQTRPPLPGSPAIDAGTSGPSIPATDQRGLGRVGAVDIGAFESQGFNFAAAPGGTPQTSDIGTAFARPLTVSVTANYPVEPVNGGRVSFVANPAVNGATAIFVEPSAGITNGQAALTAVPNNVLGSYTVVTRAAHGSSAIFALSNAGTPFAALVVNTTSDALAPGAGLLSLREAIAFTNTSPTGNSPITFDSGIGRLFSTPQKITLTGPQLELSNALGTASITGPAAGVTINSGGLRRVLQVDAVVTASIWGITFTGGNSGHYRGVVSGGLNNLGTATLTNCAFSGNDAEKGGGVANDGTATLINCTFSGNYTNYGGGGAANDGGGGGVVNDGTATLINCTFSGNYTDYGGGGVANDGTATLINCTFSGNRANLGGGGVANDGTATLINCTFSGNSAGLGGGVFVASGSVSITGSTISRNTTAEWGGGVFVGWGASLTLTGSTVSGNKATGNGGGVFVGGGASLTLTDSTVSDNSARIAGGGLYLSDSTTLIRNSTIAHNTAAEGGGIYSDSQPVVQSTIVANNFSVAGPDLLGSVTATFSLIGNTARATLGPGSANNLLNRDPLLGPLADNGGPTLTHALQPGSPAINAGSNPANLTTDQRQAGFPRVFGLAADIGAFEVQQPTVSSVDVNAGQANLVQRSMVTSLTVTFGGLVTFAGPATSAFQLRRTGPGGTLGDVTLAVDLAGSTAMQTVARLTFSGSLTEGANSLIDGHYTLTVLSSQVNGGLFGGDNVSTLFRLYGDGNGDKAFNGLDLSAFRTAFGRASTDAGYVSYLDFNGDGAINGLDLPAFRGRFGITIP